MHDQPIGAALPVSGRMPSVTGAGNGAGQSSPIAHQAEQPDDNAVQAIFRQLNQSLTVLSSAAELVLEGRASGTASQRIRIWLQPNARQAEEALHRLRDMHLAQAPAATDLIQCLTVLVLAADMIVQGHLSGDHTSESYSLLRRNAERAMKSLHELRSQLSANTRSNGA